MDRYINYAGQIPLETDLLNSNRNAMVALSKLSVAMFGTTTTVSGLACAPTTVPSMSVTVAPGEIYSLANIDSTAYSSLSADTTHQVCKQGISLDQLTFALTAPVTGGFSVNYLIEAQYQEVDSVSVVLPYYNAANPATAWSGPNNTGASQPTERKGNVLVQVKTGVAAATGTQVTPAADSGFVPLYVVTVAFGQTTITSTSIARHGQAPIVPASVVGAMQFNYYNYAVDTGAGNAYVASYAPAITSLIDGMELVFKATHTNSGAATLAVNGLSASPILGPTQLAISASTILANSQYQVVWNAGLSSWVLCNIGSSGGLTSLAASLPLSSSGGATPTLSIRVANASQSGYLAAADWSTFNSKGTVTAVTVTSANGVSASVANQGTTPALTISLGAISPTSVASAGGVSGTTGTFSGALSGASYSGGAISGTTGTFSGAVTATGGFQSSDKRLKKNITPRAVQRGFALKLARMFCEWDRIADGAHDVGLVAQRVKTLAARYVIRGKGKRGMLAIDKAGIALEASMDNALSIAELQDELKLLRRRLAKLERGQ